MDKETTILYLDLLLLEMEDQIFDELNSPNFDFDKNN